MNILNKYIIYSEKFKASYKQSMSTGQIFFEVSVTASTTKELKEVSTDAINSCTLACNEFNKKLEGNGKKEKKSPAPPKKIKKPTVKGME